MARVRRYGAPMRSSAVLVLAVLATISLAGPASGASNRWRQPRTWTIAHQGGEDESPSNTLYAFRRAVDAGADMLELDVGVTKDGHVVVEHDTTLDARTSGTGTIASHTLREVQRVDAAYWFSAKGPNHYDHSRETADYPLRGVATGGRRPPKGFHRADFTVPTLAAVLRAFRHTPINVEIKGRTKTEGVPEYLTNARALARELRGVRRRDVNVVSFKQAAVQEFHRLAPGFDLAPGIDGAAKWLLGSGSPGAGVRIFQLPITYRLNGTTLAITTPDNVARAHREGFAWQNWFSDEDHDGPATWRTLIRACVDGVMTSKPRAFAKVLSATPNPAACAAR